MSNLAMEVSVGVIALGVAITIYYLIRNKYREDRERDAFVPPVIELPEESESIMLGPYYGDADAKRCVTVVSVENGVVAFRYIKPRGSVNSMPIEAFVAQFTKYPNGCELTA
jgi:hypothetical protein